MPDDPTRTHPALTDWIGRVRSRSQIAAAEPMHGLAALLSNGEVSTEAGQPIPLLGHWLYFQDFTPQSALGEDGHARRGSFLPPVPLPRRMWAGSDIAFHKPLRIGENIQLQSTITAVESKQGRTGNLVFVKVEHKIEDTSGPVLSEQQTLAYREAASRVSLPLAAERAPSDAEWKLQIRPDPVLLFRYSALTFNAHRIHFDRPYAMDVEGYPGLVVHGPLIATMMLQAFLAHRPDSVIVRFTFRAVRPIFDTDVFYVGGSMDGNHGVTLFACDEQDNLCMRATVRLG